MFYCTEIHGKDLLVADLRIECYTAIHGFQMSLAAIGVLLYAIGIPFYFLSLLRASKLSDLSKYKEAKIIFGRYIPYL